MVKYLSHFSLCSLDAVFRELLIVARARSGTPMVVHVSLWQVFILFLVFWLPYVELEIKNSSFVGYNDCT